MSVPTTSDAAGEGPAESGAVRAAGTDAGAKSDDDSDADSDSDADAGGRRRASTPTGWSARRSVRSTIPLPGGAGIVGSPSRAIAAPSKASSRGACNGQCPTTGAPSPCRITASAVATSPCAATARASRAWTDSSAIPRRYRHRGHDHEPIKGPLATQTSLCPEPAA
ncbi:MAG: hypothetical protein HYZ20_12835 [Burkholderiales bacterium]|nr:hypothetical protein [Burkholderiales bacterium]